MHWSLQPRLTLVTAGLAWAVLCAPVRAQVIQLPSVHNFSYSGSAWVPDAGTAGLAGGSYSRNSSQAWGPYSGSAANRVSTASTLSASLQIIDLKALDDAILNANVQPGSGANPVVSADSPAADGGRSYLSTSATGSYMDRRELSRDPNAWTRALAGESNRNQTQPSLVESDIRYYLRQGQAAEKQNRILASRVYYRMAIEAMTPDMVARYQAILAEREAAENEKTKPQSGRVKF